MGSAEDRAQPAVRMNPMAERTHCAAFWLCCLCALGCSASVAWAQESPSASYRDHYIDDGALAPDISTDDAGTSDAGALAHSLRVDGVMSVLSGTGASAPGHTDEYGIVLNSQWDTASYGAWSAELAASGG